MKLWNEFLGFMVLSGPLVVMVPWLLFCVWAGAKAAKRFTSGSAKFAVGLGVAVLLMMPVADEIAGRIYLNHLCATEAGVKVYRTVELPAEYWDEQGRPRFFNQYGNLERDLWLSKLDESSGDIKRHSTVFAIDKRTSSVKERTSQKVLAEVTTFLYWGGWLRRNLSPHNTANTCGFIVDSNFSRSFYGQIFKPATSSN